jgi:hypothetical protein
VGTFISGMSTRSFGPVVTSPFAALPGI